MRSAYLSIIPSWLANCGTSVTRQRDRSIFIPLAFTVLSFAIGLSREAAGQAVPVSPAPANPLPPELVALDAEYSQLQRERVTTPYEAELKKLNTSYRDRINDVWKLEMSRSLLAELDLLRNNQPIPETDAKNTPRSLVNLRTTYRSAKKSLDVKRAADLKFLIDPLARRLVQMAADFTRAGRVADAKAVEEYRDALGKLLGASGPAPKNITATPVSAESHTNSLGMKFLVVKDTDVMFCIHETRRKDYATYANGSAGVDASWTSQQMDGVPCGDKDDHPVVGVSWEEANAFLRLAEQEGGPQLSPADGPGMEHRGWPRLRGGGGSG